MKAPDKIYVAESLIKAPYGNEWSPTPYVSRESTEYIRKDLVAEMLDTTENHSFLDGQEKLREELLEWAKKENLKFNHIGNEQDDNFARGIASGLGHLISKLSSL